MGMKTKPSRRTGAAAVLASGVAAGTIASNKGSARLAPIARRNVLRGSAFFVMIIRNSSW
jgi:hypothetical protein